MFGGFCGFGECLVFFNGKVIEVVFYGVNGYGIIEVGVVIGYFVGVVVDMIVDGREGVVGG